MKFSQIARSVLLTGAFLCIAGFSSASYALCKECGKVTNLKTVKVKGEGTGAGVVAGGILGGVLGHQVGGGRGKDLATVGGAIAGGAIGTTVGRDGRPQHNQTQDVQRCTSVPSQAQPALWDVGYVFRGQEHRVQMTTPPGRSITVNGAGEPRA